MLAGIVRFRLLMIGADNEDGNDASSLRSDPYKPDTDKRARLIAQTDLFAGGSVRLPRRAGWLEEFVAELLSFPSRHDDQVDALTQGLDWVANSRVAR